MESPKGVGMGTRKPNRGPAVTASNRAALMSAARSIFASKGLSAPLSSIAKKAGVSQGVLYRHFRSRMDLVVAVFDENMEKVDRALADKAADELGFDAAWRKLVELTMSDVAFIETAVHSNTDPRIHQLGVDIRDILNPLVAEAKEAGRLKDETTVETLFLALRAIYGLVTTNGEGMAPVGDQVAELLAGLGLSVR